MNITHYLTVQLCKRVFFDDRFGVMRSFEPLIFEENFPLKPVFILGVSVDNLPLKYTQYFLVGENASISKFLTSFWNNRYTPDQYKPDSGDTSTSFEITGCPDILMIDHRAKDAILPDFINWLEDNNIQYRFTDSKNKTAISKFRQHQNFPTLIYPDADQFKAATYQALEEPFAITLNELNRKVLPYKWLCTVKKHISTINAYINREKSLSPISLDNRPELDSSKITPITTNNDILLEDAYWAPSELNHSAIGYLDNRQTANTAESERSDKYVLLAAVKALENQWQTLFDGEHLEILKMMKKRRIKDTTLLNDHNYDAICETLLLENYRDSYQNPSLVFNISKLNKSEIIELWDHYSGGGNVQFSCELSIPDWKCSIEDKNYRFFYMVRYYDKDTFFVAEKGSVGCDTFDNGHCTNYDSKHTLDLIVIDENLNLDNVTAMLFNSRPYVMYLSQKLQYFYSKVLSY